MTPPRKPGWIERALAKWINRLAKTLNELAWRIRAWTLRIQLWTRRKEQERQIRDYLAEAEAMQPRIKEPQPVLVLRVDLSDPDLQVTKVGDIDQAKAQEWVKAQQMTAPSMEAVAHSLASLHEAHRSALEARNPALYAENTTEVPEHKPPEHLDPEQPTTNDYQNLSN